MKDKLIIEPSNFVIFFTVFPKYEMYTVNQKNMCARVYSPNFESRKSIRHTMNDTIKSIKYAIQPTLERVQTMPKRGTFQKYNNTFCSALNFFNFKV